MSDVALTGAGDHKVIALHGWFGHGRAWGPLVESLDGARFTYAFPDYRGYGARKGEAGEFTMDEIASDTLALADRLGWDRFSLVGHSMGGMAMQRVASLAPQRVRKMLGISPIPTDGFPWDEGSWAFFHSAAKDADARYGILDITTGKRLTPTWIKQVQRTSLENSTVEAFAAYLLAWGRSNFLDAMSGNTVPLHVIVGEHDPAVSEAFIQSRLVAHQPHATVEVMPNAGHYAMFETPVALATSIERFLAD